MTLSIVLEEEDLRALPDDIREGLLRWYFATNRRRQPPAASIPAPLMDDDDSRRVTFRKLMAAGLLKSGEEIHCRTLKRQQRNGNPKYIKGATVGAGGAVEYNGEQFQNPSNLAVAMVKQSGGKPTALNGFDYLFVRSGKGLVALKNLRDRLSTAKAAVRDYKQLSGNDTLPEDHVNHRLTGVERQ